VFLKDASRVDLHPNRIVASLSTFDNGFVFGSDDVMHMMVDAQDFRVVMYMQGLAG
jgi:hypothetical protein